MMAMLNAGFRRGARVPRVIDAKTSSFYEFNVYAPRVLAGINRLSTTLADRSFRIELVRKRSDARLERFSTRQQGKRLARLRDDLHLAALGHAREIIDAYNHAEEFNISTAIDDRLRDIIEPLFAIAYVADANEGGKRHTKAIVEAARRLADVRNVRGVGEDAGLIAARAALNTLGRPNGRDPVISSVGALALFQRTDGLKWINTRDMARTLLRQLGFRSGIHRRERFVECHPRPRPETARGYEIDINKL